MKTKFNKYWFVVALCIIANVFIFRVLAARFSNYLDVNIARHTDVTDVDQNPQLQKQLQDASTPAVIAPDATGQ